MQTSGNDGDFRRILSWHSGHTGAFVMIAGRRASLPYCICLSYLSTIKFLYDFRIAYTPKLPWIHTISAHIFPRKSPASLVRFQL